MTELPLLKVPAQPIWAWADLHLHADAPEEVHAFAQTLQSVPEEIKCVLILGDLFDAWIGPETWEQPTFKPLKTAFLGLGQRSIQVILLRGNRDVLMESADAALINAQLADRVLLTSEPPVLFSHGDEYCLNDHSYQKLRRTLRRPLLRKALQTLPLGVRGWIAGKMRSHSQDAVGRKPLDALALDENAVDYALQTAKATLAVIGHLHAAKVQKLPSGRKLEVLPAWTPNSSPWTFAK